MKYLRVVLLLVYAVGTYTSLAIQVAGAYVLGAYSMIAGLILLAFHLSARENATAFRGLALLLTATLAWSFTIPFSPDLGFAGQHFRSLAMLVVSALSAYGAYLEFRRIERERMTKILLSLSIALIFLAALEAFTSFNEFSNAVRAVLYKGRFIYDADLRDVLIAGGVRPKVFTQEPSHVARFVSVCIAGYTILNTGRYRLLKGLALWVVAMGLLRSPSMLLGVGAVAAHQAFFVIAPEGRRTFLSSMVRIAAVAAPILGLMFLPNIAGLIPLERAQSIASGRDLSSVYRSIGPASVAWETVKDHPIAGAAIGGRELVQDEVVKVYSRFPGIWLAQLRGVGEGMIGWGNAFFEIFTYSGAVLGAILVPLLIFSLRAFSGSVLVSTIMFFLAFNFDAGFVMPRPWAYFGFLMAVVWIYERSSLSCSSFALLPPNRSSNHS